MPRAHLEKLAKPFLEGVQAAGPDMARTMLETMRQLLQGTPVSTAAIAAQLRTTRDEVEALLKQFGAEKDAEGNVVGLAVSLTPTPHRYTVNGRELYTWCAVDTIVIPAFFGHTATVESPDPVTGEPVRLVITPDGPQDVEPETTVVSWIPEMEDWHDSRNVFCADVHFFRSPDTASEWLQTHEGAEILTVNDVYRIGQIWKEQEPIKLLYEQQKRARTE